MNGISTEEILLSVYLPPVDVLREWLLGAVIGFIVVQVLKSWRRARRAKDPRAQRGRLDRFEMSLATGGITAVSCYTSLVVVSDYPQAQAVLYAVQGGIVAPLTITALLYLLGLVAPELRAKLSQDRRTRSAEHPHARRLDDLDDTQDFL